MKNKKEKYSIYGDDEQEKLERLQEQEPEILDYVKAYTEKVTKDRAKEHKKTRKIKDTTINRASPLYSNSKNLTDVEQGEIISSESTVEEKPVAPKKDKKPKDKNKRKKAVNKIMISILALIILSAGLSVLYPQIKPHIDSLLSKDDGMVTIEPSVTDDSNVDDNIINVATTEGRLPLLENDREYTISDSLLYADTINEVIKNYFTDMINIAKRYERNEGDMLISVEVKELRDQVAIDKQVLYSYESLFGSYNGESYLKSASVRLDNFSKLVNELEDGMSVSSLYQTVNRYILNENGFAEDSKAELITYLTRNEIDYTDNGNYISFNLLEDDVTLEQEQDIDNEGTDLGPNS